MEAMARGIEESVQWDHIRARIGQVEYFGEKLTDIGIPIVLPVGGHAVFLDAKTFLPHLKQIEFPAQTLATELFLESGIRSMERSIVSAGRNKETGDHYYPKFELIRLTFPRRVYTQAHCDVTVEAVDEVFNRRESIKGLEMIYEPKYLRFFQARFERL
jgi:tyrosine phenol-lyase